MSVSKEITLASGKVAVIAPFKGKHVFEAQRRISDSGSADSGSVIKTMIGMLVKIDGEGIVPEDLDEMDGQDVLALMGEFSAANFR